MASNVPAVAAGRHKNSRCFLIPKDNQKIYSYKNFLQPASVLQRVCAPHEHDAQIRKVKDKDEKIKFIFSYRIVIFQRVQVPYQRR